ncbi:MAG: prolipoprotein diacylglyceryl transferase [Capnocytophaga sp.]|nr:prolipoprotein diacylglyceryl transferase [Capnocytophaga sp.]
MNWNPDQILFDLGFIQIRYYSLMYVIAFVLGYYIMKKIFIRENKPLERLDSLVVYVGLATLIGARLGHCLFYDWDYFKDHLLEIILPFQFSPTFRLVGFSGLASHGAAIGIIISMVLFIRKFPEFSLSWILDRIVIPITIGGMFVRIGNFINSEINGKIVEKTSPFAVKFLQGESWLSHRQAMQITGENSPQKAFEQIINNPQFADIYNQIPYRHPAQLYEAVCYFFLFWILYFLYWKTEKRNQPYFIFAVFLIALWTIRFFVEFVKESQGGFESALGIFSTGQWLSIPFIIAGVFLLFYNKWKIHK